MKKKIAPENLSTLLDELPSDYDSDTELESDCDLSDDQGVLPESGLSIEVLDAVLIPEIGSEEPKSNTAAPNSKLLPNSRAQTIPLAIPVGTKFDRSPAKLTIRAVRSSAVTSTSSIAMKTANENYSFDMLLPKWKKRILAAPTMGTFSEESGPKCDFFDDCSTPTDFFLRLWNRKLLDQIVEQTNLYSQQKIDKLASAKIFKTLTVTELLGFLGINIIMSYHTVPDMKMYWESSDDVQVPAICKSMSRNRFCQIRRFIHLNDNHAIPEGCKDKLFKIRPLIEKLNIQFSGAWNEAEALSVDESMILFKGRSSMKQYNPMKPIKRGYKIWCIACMSGYIYRFEIYQGKKEEASVQAQLGLGGRVVVELTAPLASKHHMVYFDNYFTSIELLYYLKKKVFVRVGQ